MSKQTFIREMLSEHGVASSKRVLGMICLFVCLGCLIYLVRTEGGTQTVENTLQTIIIVASTLLGLGSITNTASAIFGGDKSKKKDKSNDNVEDAEG